MDTVSFEDISWLFSKHGLWCTINELYWYENMWLILEKQGLTVYEEEKDRYRVLLYAVCLMLIYSDFSEDEYDDPVEFDYIADELEDDIPALVLGQLYAAQGLPLTEDADEALVQLARTKMKHVIAAIKKEIGMNDLFTSLYAVFWKFHTFEENEEGEMEEVEFFPDSADEFWSAFLRERDDIFSNFELSLEGFSDAYVDCDHL